MHDLDDRDPYPPPWHAGPPPRRTPGPVIEAYADTDALEFDCPNCHAEAGEFCTLPAELGGGPRKAPCKKRIDTAAHAARERQTRQEVAET
jgi:hypothetical protein